MSLFAKIEPSSGLCLLGNPSKNKIETFIREIICDTDIMFSVDHKEDFPEIFFEVDSIEDYVVFYAVDYIHGNGCLEGQSVQDLKTNFIVAIYKKRLKNETS